MAGLIGAYHPSQEPDLGLHDADNKPLDAEPLIMSFLKSMLIGGGPMNSAVMLLDPPNVNNFGCYAAGSKIDFAKSLGQNDKGWG